MQRELKGPMHVHSHPSVSGKLLFLLHGMPCRVSPVLVPTFALTTFLMLVSLQVEKLDMLTQHINKHNYSRTGLYLLAWAWCVNGCCSESTFRYTISSSPGSLGRVKGVTHCTPDRDQRSPPSVRPSVRPSVPPSLCPSLPSSLCPSLPPYLPLSLPPTLPPGSVILLFTPPPVPLPYPPIPFHLLQLSA